LNAILTNDNSNSKNTSNPRIVKRIAKIHNDSNREIADVNTVIVKRRSNSGEKRRETK